MGRVLVYLFDLIFIYVVGWIIRRILQGSARGAQRGPRRVPRRDASPSLQGETARDPVCGMFVSTEVSHRLKRGNETLHFCSQECLNRYQAEVAHS